MSQGKGSDIRITPSFYNHEREVALREFARVKRELDALLAKTEDWKQQLGDVAFPQVPALTSIPAGEAETIRKETSRLRGLLEEYKRAVHAAVMEARQKQVARVAEAETAQRLADLGVGMAVTANDLVTFFGDARLFNHRAREDQQLANIHERADKMMAHIDGRSMISTSCGKAYADLLCANDPADAKIRLKYLESEIDREKSRFEALEQREKTDWAAAQLAATLQEMGYAVSGVEESAYIKDGKIFGVQQGKKQHPVQLQFDKNDGHVTAQRVRIVDGNPIVSAAEKAARRRADQDADIEFCSENGIGALRKEAARRGVQLRFVGQHEPGAASVPVLQKSEVLNASPTLAELYEPEQVGGIVRTRSHDDEVP